MAQIQFPYLGNSLVMAIVILTHVFLAFIAVGGITIAVVSEYIGYTKKSPYHDLLAKKYMNFISNLMKVGGVFGTAIVVLLIGLFGEFTKTLFNIFFFPLLLEALMFFVLFASSIYYRETWNNTKNKKLHLFSGFIAALAGIIAAFIINTVWSFMLTPGSYFKNPSMTSAVFNPLAFSAHRQAPSAQMPQEHIGYLPQFHSFLLVLGFHLGLRYNLPSLLSIKFHLLLVF